MAGRWQFLFNWMRTVKHPNSWKAYQQAGIDRLVIGP